MNEECAESSEHSHAHTSGGINVKHCGGIARLWPRRKFTGRKAQQHSVVGRCPKVPRSIRADFGWPSKPKTSVDRQCAGESGAVSWEFSWSTVASATQYQLYVRGPHATIPLVDVLTEGTQYRQYSIGEVSGRNLNDWSWKVRALVDSRRTSWSEDRHFNVQAAGTDVPRHTKLRNCRGNPPHRGSSQERSIISLCFSCRGSIVCKRSDMPDSRI